MSAAVSLDALRARIRALEGSARVERRRVASGVEVVDRLIEGLPCPGIVEISGVAGSGRTRLVLALVRAVIEAGGHHRPVAWVDPLRQLYPPAVAALGIPLDRLLLVRPPAAGLTGGVHPEIWATEQLLRSGCFPLVVSMLPSRGGPGEGPGFGSGGFGSGGFGSGGFDRGGLDRGRRRAGGHQWARAAERGRCTVVVLADRPRRDLPAEVRLQCEAAVGRPRGGGVLRVLRDRGGRPGAWAPLPWPEAVDPWGWEGAEGP